MIQNFLNTHEVGLTVSSIASFYLAWFGDHGFVSASIAILLVINLLVGIIAGIVNIRRKK